MATAFKLDPAYRRVSVDEFLAMDFGDAKAELVDGLIYMMAGGDRLHAHIAANLIIALGKRLRGRGCFPYGSDFGVQTAAGSVRYPDVSIICDEADDLDPDFRALLGKPRAVFEVLSPSTENNDLSVKLAEYQAVNGIGTVVLVNPRDESLRLFERLEATDWDEVPVPADADLVLRSFGITLPRAEIFARR